MNTCVFHAYNNNDAMTAMSVQRMHLDITHHRNGHGEDNNKIDLRKIFYENGH
jgi:hypothetical protein